MPLTEHLAELRQRLVRAFIAVGIACVLAYLVVDYIFAWLLAPLREAGGDRIELIGTGVGEAFFTQLKVALIAGIFLASPAIFYQLWKFVTPGLYPEERRYALPFVVFATIFFVAGAWFCYTVVFPIAFDFFLGQFDVIAVAPFLRISEYLTFSSRLLLAFGIVFELPVATFFLARIGVVTHHTLVSTWRYAVIVVFGLSAILTPPDAVSQVLMAGPLLVLYVASIGIAYVFARKPRDPEE